MKGELCEIRRGVSGPSIAGITSISYSGQSVEQVDTTPLGATVKTSRAGLLSLTHQGM